MKKSFFVLVGAIVFFASCEKFKPTTSENKSSSNRSYWKRSEVDTKLLNEDPFCQKMSAGQDNYMRLLSEINQADLAKAMAALKHEYTKTEIVWGLGPDRRVYRWNGSSWDEPNPAAGLDYVDVATTGGSVWGISATHIYKWNGATWSEPNPAAGLYTITAISPTMAFGIGGSGIPYVTIDGGLSWFYMGSIQKLSYLNASDFNNKSFAVQTLTPNPSSPPRMMSYEYSTNSWTNVTTPSSPKVVDCGSTGGPIYYIENGSGAQHIYKSSDGGLTFSQPNSAATLSKLAVSNSSVWGIGGTQRIFRSTNGGASWDEPNPIARLAFVSAGN